MAKASVRKTTEQFIEEAKAVHGNTYDYSQVDYVGNKVKVKIICPEHGVFEQAPVKHLSGQGCPKCSRKKAKNTWLEKYGVENPRQSKEIADKIQQTVRDKYGVDYVVQSKEVRDSVNENVLCSVGKRTQNFLNKAKKVHGNRYDYSKVKYVNCKTNVEIICSEHGSFYQTPNAHLRGQGCPVCNGNLVSTTNEFIKKAKAIHGDKYDYSKVDYINNRMPVEIVCPEHGSFFQDPHNHLKGKGCAKCAGRARLTNDDFIEKANLVHGNKYDYSKTKYINNASKIKIICSEHGVFEQEANSHLLGSGCPLCGRLQAKDTLKDTMNRLYGADSYFESAAYLKKRDEYIKRSFETKKERGNINTSKPEEMMYEKLIQQFGKSDVERQYMSDKYPFACDFYVKSNDLYIELNGSWTHGGHWFDVNDENDLSAKAEWINKANDSQYYKCAIDTWCHRDVKKRQIAIDNNLNYLVFWDTKLRDFDLWISFGCPVGNDAIKEYSWMQ